MSNGNGDLEERKRLLLYFARRILDDRDMSFSAIHRFIQEVQCAEVRQQLTEGETVVVKAACERIHTRLQSAISLFPLFDAPDKRP